MNSRRGRRVYQGITSLRETPNRTCSRGRCSTSKLLNGDGLSSPRADCRVHWNWVTDKSLNPVRQRATRIGYRLIGIQRRRRGRIPPISDACHLTLTKRSFDLERVPTRQGWSDEVGRVRRRRGGTLGRGPPAVGSTGTSAGPDLELRPSPAVPRLCVQCGRVLAYRHYSGNDILDDEWRNNRHPRRRGLFKSMQLRKR